MTPQPKPDPAEDWKPHSTPGFEINGLGHLRTVGHKPPDPPKQKEAATQLHEPAGLHRQT